MGYGDEIMATGDALTAHRQTGLRVAIGPEGGPVRWHEVFDGNPLLATQADVDAGEPVAWVPNYRGYRPYIDYDRVFELGRARLGRGHHGRKELMRAAGRWFFTRYRATPGQLYLTDAERELTARCRERGPYVVVEPHVKPQAANKDWGFHRWQALVGELRRRCFLRVIQVNGTGRRALDDVEVVPTRTFRESCAVVAGAGAAVLPEGGLHHAAAALSVPAVVIFGGFASARCTGYDAHDCVTYDHPDTPCGTRTRCPHCAEAMASIRPGEVAERLRALLAR